MKLTDWMTARHESAHAPTPQAVEDNIVLDALTGRTRSSRPLRLIVLLVLLVVVALLQPRLSRAAARFAPPIASTGEFLMQSSGRWEGHRVFTVDRSAAVLAAIADGTWPAPERAWPNVRALQLVPDLYALGPDHTGGMMYYAMPGPDGHGAWLASPGPDGQWASGKEDPREVAEAIDDLARLLTVDTLAWVKRGEFEAPWSYNVLWDDDHIVLLDLMLLARGRHEVVQERMVADRRAVRNIRRLDLPGLWSDEAAAAADLLAAIHAVAADSTIADAG